MRLEFIAHTPDIETVIAASMLTTTSGAKPSTLYRRLKANPEKVRGIVGRLEVQHGSILEHNRLTWRLEAGEGEVLDILMRSRFFAITRLGDSEWLVSANLRTVVEYHERWRDEFGEALVESIQEVAPMVYGHARRKSG